MIEKLKKFIISLVLAALAISGCTRTVPSETGGSESKGFFGLFAKTVSTPVPPGDYVHTIDIKKEAVEAARTRSYTLHVPASYTDETEVGLLFLFPADGETGRDFLKETNFLSFTDNEGFIVVVPDAYSEGMKWNNGVTKTDGPDDLLFISSLVTKIKDSFKIDNNKVFVAGKATGGIMAYQVAASMSDQFAAVGVFGASAGFRLQDGAKPLSITAPANPISVFAIHGMEDGLIPYGNSKAAKNAKSGYMTFGETESFWKEAIGCGDNMQAKQTKHDHLLWHNWAGCKNNTELKTLSIWSGDNDWPEGTAKIKGVSVDIPATQVIWEFLVNHPRTDS